jgi:hypothetical protein
MAEGLNDHFGHLPTWKGQNWHQLSILLNILERFISSGLAMNRGEHLVLKKGDFDTGHP